MSNCTFSCFYKVLKLKRIVVALPSPQITELSPKVMLFMPKESWTFDKSGLHTQVPRSQSPWGTDPRQLKVNGESKLTWNLNLSNRSLKYSKRGRSQAQAHFLPPLPHPSPLPAPKPLTAPCTCPPSGFSIIYVNTSLLPGPPLPQPLASLLSQDMLTPHQGAQEARSQSRERVRYCPSIQHPGHWAVCARTPGIWACAWRHPMGCVEMWGKDHGAGPPCEPRGSLPLKC